MVRLQLTLRPEGPDGPLSSPSARSHLCSVCPGPFVGRRWSAPGSRCPHRRSLCAPRRRSSCVCVCVLSAVVRSCGVSCRPSSLVLSLVGRQPPSAVVGRLSRAGDPNSTAWVCFGRGWTDFDHIRRRPASATFWPRATTSDQQIDRNRPDSGCVRPSIASFRTTLGRDRFYPGRQQHLGRIRGAIWSGFDQVLSGLGLRAGVPLRLGLASTGMDQIRVGSAQSAGRRRSEGRHPRSSIVVRRRSSSVVGRRHGSKRDSAPL